MKGSRTLTVAKGILAIIVWTILYAFVQLFRAIGWQGYLAIALPIFLILWIGSLVSSRLRRFLTKQLPDKLENILGIYEEKMEWVVYFIFVLMYGGIVYFILFAPYGVLCRLGVRQCGNW